MINSLWKSFPLKYHTSENIFTGKCIFHSSRHTNTTQYITSVCVSEFCLCAVCTIWIFWSAFFISIFSICFLDVVCSVRSMYFNYILNYTTQPFGNQYCSVIVWQHFYKCFIFYLVNCKNWAITQIKCGLAAKAPFLKRNLFVYNNEQWTILIYFD